MPLKSLKLPFLSVPSANDRRLMTDLATEVDDKFTRPQLNCSEGEMKAKHVLKYLVYQTFVTSQVEAEAKSDTKLYVDATLFFHDTSEVILLCFVYVVRCLHKNVQKHLQNMTFCYK